MARKRRNYWQLHDKEWLIDHYWNKQLSTEDIGDIIGCDRRVVYNALRRLKIRTRNCSEAKALSKEKQRRIRISKEDLYDLYWNKKLSLVEIGEIFSCSHIPILNYMKAYNISRRSSSEMNTKVHIPEEELYDLYWEQDLNLNEIGKIYKCDPTTIHNILVRYGIKIKTYHEARKKSDWSVNIPKEELERLYCIENWGIEKISEHFHCVGATVFRNMIIYGIPRRPPSIAKHATQPLSKELLEELYWKEGLTITQIAKKLGYHFVTIHEHMVEYGINYRTKSERYSGERNPMFGRRGERAPSWQGGVSFFPYCPEFNFALKEEIRDKFGRKCFLCPKTEEENGKRLAVHHVDGDKMQGCNGKKWFLVPLCSSCHSKTNHNQDYWNRLITDKLNHKSQ